MNLHACLQSLDGHHLANTHYSNAGLNCNLHRSVQEVFANSISMSLKLASVLGDAPTFKQRLGVGRTMSVTAEEDEEPS